MSGTSLLVESFFGLLPSAALVLDDTQVRHAHLRFSLFLRFLNSVSFFLAISQMTPAQSLGSLSCVACPAHSTISNAPRTSAKVRFLLSIERVSANGPFND